MSLTNIEIYKARALGILNTDDDGVSWLLTDETWIEWDIHLISDSLLNQPQPPRVAYALAKAVTSLRKSIKYWEDPANEDMLHLRLLQWDSVLKHGHTSSRI